MVTNLIATAVPWTLGALVLFGIIVSFVFNVSGTWERIPIDDEPVQSDADGYDYDYEDDDDDDDEYQYSLALNERLVLGQFGPFVTGRRDLPGGHQEFSGFMVGRTLRINRRDHGVRSLVRQGFPEVIAKLVDGDVTGKFKLTLVSAGLLLDGSFSPQKIEFTHRPPRVTARNFLVPKPRRYRRLTAKELAAEKVIPVQVENQIG